MPKLTIITALMSEAVPIVDYYRLKKQPKVQGFHLYRANELDLVICGMGAKPMRAGLNKYIKSMQDAMPHTWLNIGVAGALGLPLQKLVWANSVGGKLITRPTSMNNQPKFNVVSLAEPSYDYQPGSLFDMEAQTCFEMVQYFSRELGCARFFCAKVISDNQRENAHQVDKHWVMNALRLNMDALSTEIDKLLNHKGNEVC